VNRRTGLNHPPVSVKRAVIARDGGFCLYALPGCQGEATTTDHRANRQAGGSRLLNHPGNLCAICWSCNSAKADAHAITLFDLEERGLWVRAGATHAATLQRVLETTVTDLEGRRWLLIDEHTRKEVE
jgi:hypothetical protein